MAEGRLAGRVAIVTGASRGLGKAIAEAFAREGSAVAVVARTEAVWDERLPGTIHETVAEIESAGGRAVAVAADLANPADVDRLVGEVRAALGPIDLLVNNAALTVPGRPPAQGTAGQAPITPGLITPAPVTPGPITPAPITPGPITAATSASASASGASRPTSNMGRGSFLEFPLKGFRLHFEIGLFSTYRLMQLVLPDMIAAGRGAVINISSQAAFVPGEGPYPNAGMPGSLAYGGNKAAMHHLTQTVAYEMAAHGITVNALLPSEPVITPGNLVAAAGITEWASPEDFAEATIRVALADAKEMTGQILWSDDVLHPELGRRGWMPG